MPVSVIMADGVVDEVPLGVEGGFEAGEEVVEDGAESGQLVGGLAEVEALVEVAGGDGLGGGGDGPQGPEESAGDDREDHDPGDEDARGVEEREPGL